MLRTVWKCVEFLNIFQFFEKYLYFLVTPFSIKVYQNILHIKQSITIRIPKYELQLQPEQKIHYFHGVSFLFNAIYSIPYCETVNALYSLPKNNLCIMHTLVLFSKFLPIKIHCWSRIFLRNCTLKASKWLIFSMKQSTYSYLIKMNNSTLS